MPRVWLRYNIFSVVDPMRPETRLMLALALYLSSTANTPDVPHKNFEMESCAEIASQSIDRETIMAARTHDRG